MRVLITTIVMMSVTAAVSNLDVLRAVSSQRLAMMRAEWQDKETWSHYNESQRENELGLGLQVPGPTGLTFVAFTAALSVRAPGTAPSEIGVQVALGKFANPNVVRRPSLVFVADPETNRSVRLDLSARLEVDDPTPGGRTENGATTMRTADFVRLVEAQKIAGEILGFEAVVRDDQLVAMREFATRVHVKFKVP